MRPWMATLWQEMAPLTPPVWFVTVHVPWTAVLFVQHNRVEKSPSSFDEGNHSTEATQAVHEAVEKSALAARVASAYYGQARSEFELETKLSLGSSNSELDSANIHAASHPFATSSTIPSVMSLPISFRNNRS